MKAVVKAVLLDPEARRGDDPATAAASDGKLREPWLHTHGTWRGLGCTSLPAPPESGWTSPSRPCNTRSSRPACSAYAPTDRAPGSNLLAPDRSCFGFYAACATCAGSTPARDDLAARARRLLARGDARATARTWRA
jgi:hypothetical protein